MRWLTPHLCVESVLDISVERLRSLNIQWLLLDVDSTLKRYREEMPGTAIMTWVSRIRAEGIGVCLFSNGGTQRIGLIAEKLGVPFVSKACKPLPLRCGTAIQYLKASWDQTALVGDQIFADVLAGRLAGLLTILVRPMHPEDEPRYTRIKRPLETRLLRRFFQDSSQGMLNL